MGLLAPKQSSGSLYACTYLDGHVKRNVHETTLLARRNGPRSFT
jgi:hypothetical protein